nr:response regulator [uncultured Lichenicoccus sp.]
MCILLVEDEPLIREVMTESLQEAGFEVMQAENGERAAELISDPPCPFSALVTDFHMPGRIDGAGVASRMRKAWPKIPVVIVSGRPEVFRAQWESEDGYGLLRKPYLPQQLIDLVRRLVQSAPPPGA